MSIYDDLLEKTPEGLRVPATLRFPGACEASRGTVIACGCATQASGYAKSLGASRLAIIADKILLQLDMLSPLTKALDEQQIAYCIFSDIAPEPHTADLDAAGRAARDFGADAVLGIGGGSSLDTAKVTACMLTENASAADIMTGKVAFHRHVPLILLPTTSGTGSEVSPYAVASHNGKKLFISSPEAIADIALVDPLMTATMPPKVTAFTGLDALTHAVEGACGCANPFAKALAVQAVELAFEALPAAVKDGTDLYARTKRAYASVLGMMAYTLGGGLYAHSASYILTLSKNTPHGLGCGLALPHTLAMNMDSIKALLEGFIPAITRSGIATPRTASEVPAAFLALVKAVGAPATLAELGYNEADIPAFAHTLYADYYRAKNPRQVEEGDLITLVEMMYNGRTNQ